MASHFLLQLSATGPLTSNTHRQTSTPAHTITATATSSPPPPPPPLLSSRRQPLVDSIARTSPPPPLHAGVGPSSTQLPGRRRLLPTPAVTPAAPPYPLARSPDVAASTRRQPSRGLLPTPAAKNLGQSPLLSTLAPTHPVAKPNKAGGVEVGDGGVGQVSTPARRREDGGSGRGVAAGWGGHLDISLTKKHAC
uniref:Uncharacterized protein n=1 Tax=Oryza brachyantha TaxID=4533 RepID=J3LNH9_ORYBR